MADIVDLGERRHKHGVVLEKPIDTPPHPTEGVATQEAPDLELPGDELTQEDDTEPGPAPDGSLPRWRQQPERHPILAKWLVDQAERRMAARWLADHTWYRARFHTARLPVYAGRLLARSPHGAGRLASSVSHWVRDTESAPLRTQAATDKKTSEYLSLSKQHKERVRTRLVVLGAGTVLTLIATVVALNSGPVGYGLMFAALCLLGWYGRRKDTPIVPHAIVPVKARKLTPDLVVRAFTAAGLASEKEPISFAKPIRADGGGWLATIDLPYGKKASQAIDKREEIAAGLDIDEVLVFMDRVRGDRGSARRVELWVASRDVFAQKPSPSPLLGMESFDFWRPVPFGLNARGRLIAFALVWTNLLVGAIPRMGKTFAARLMAAAAALDPWVRLFVFDGKGGRDLKPFEQVAYAYGAGVRLAVVERLVAVLRDLVEDMNARFERLQTLSDEDCPDGKLTPALARNRRLNMPLTVLFIDEVQRYLENRQYGAEICELLTELVKVGPAVGIMLILATQKPDAKVVPDSLRGQIGTRFALKTMTYQASETILGAGTYSQGLDSSKFLKSHKGVGILLGADESELAEEGAQIVRTHLLNGVGLAKICARGRQLREEAGTLAGAAGGEDVVKERHDPRVVLEHVRQAFAPDESRIAWETLAERLAEAHPDRYDGWDGEQTGNILRGKPYNLGTVQVNRTVVDEETGKPRQVNLRGPLREAVLEALGRLAESR